MTIVKSDVSIKVWKIHYNERNPLAGRPGQSNTTPNVVHTVASTKAYAVAKVKAKLQDVDVVGVVCLGILLE